MSVWKLTNRSTRVGGMRVAVRVLAAVVALSWQMLAAAQIPNTFTPGTPAKASEVNANFGYVEGRLSELANAAVVNAALADLDAQVAALTASVNALNTTLSSATARLVPTGTVVAFAGTTPPSGWLKCDGTAVSRTTYSALFAAIGVAHGAGNLTTTFNLPDYRGRFLRGVDGGAGRDPDAAARIAMALNGNTGDAVGSVQLDAFEEHTHYRRSDKDYELSVTYGSAALLDTGDAGGIYTSGGYTSPYTGGSVYPASGTHFGTESRPVNAGVNYIIKY